MARQSSESDSDSDGVDNGNGVYEVERVLKMRKIRGKRQFYIRWKGYDSDEDTWEPEDNLQGAKAKVDEFMENNPDESPTKKAQKRPTNKASSSKSKSRPQKQNVAEESEPEDDAKESEDDDNEDEFEPSSSKKAKKAGKEKADTSSKQKPQQNGSSQKSPLATLVANRMKNSSNMRWLNDSDSDESNNDSGLARPSSKEKTTEDTESPSNVRKDAVISMNETLESEPLSEFRVLRSESPASTPRPTARNTSVPASGFVNQPPTTHPPLKIKIRQPTNGAQKVNADDVESTDGEPKRSSKGRGAKEKANQRLLSNGHVSTSAASASTGNAAPAITFMGAYRDSQLDAIMYVGVDKKQKRKVYTLREAFDKYGWELCSFLSEKVSFAENGHMRVQPRQISESNE